MFDRHFMYGELLEAHWEHAYNWHGLKLSALAKRYETTETAVSETMRKIERDSPKPRKRSKLR